MKNYLNFENSAPSNSAIFTSEIMGEFFKILKQITDIKLNLKEH